MPAQLSQADFEVLLRRAGLTLSAVQIAHLYGAWEHVEPMLERVRRTGRGREAEPATLYVAENVP